MGLFFGQNRSYSAGNISNIEYGYLYNWFAVSNALFAPVGWHVPTVVEFETLVTELGGETVAGDKLKDTNFWEVGSTGDNSSFFNARGGGQRSLGMDTFNALGLATFFSSVTTPDDSVYGFLYLEYQVQGTYINYTIPNLGESVRLIKDDSTLTTSLTDLDGNVYRTTKIGNQVWLADNWACTKLNNGTPLTKVTDQGLWDVLITEGYCAYDNDEANVFL